MHIHKFNQKFLGSVSKYSLNLYLFCNIIFHTQKFLSGKIHGSVLKDHLICKKQNIPGIPGLRCMIQGA